MGVNPAILVVDDEEKIRNLLRLFLEREDYLVLEAENGEIALDILAKQPVDLVVLDLMMPVMDGWTTCKKLRAMSDIPILLLTAMGEENDKVLGFELGADDYVVKPFSPREIVMRIKALLRRRGNTGAVTPVSPASEAPDMEAAGLKIYQASRQVQVEGQEINLTPMEFDLLFYLATNRGRVFTREQLLQSVWGYDYFGDVRTVDTHIKRLREKISKISTVTAECLATVWGVGYKFEVKQR